MPLGRPVRQSALPTGGPPRSLSGTLPVATLAAALVVTLVAALLVAGTVLAPARAADPASRLTLTGTAAYAGAETTLTVALVDPAGQPVAGAPVTLLRRAGGQWTPLASVVTDATGAAVAAAPLAKDPAGNVFRATYDGDPAATPPVPAAAPADLQVELRRRASRLLLTAPARVVDGRSVTLQVQWLSGNGEPVTGPVVVLRSLRGGPWRRASTVATGADGRAAVAVRPRVDSRWRVRAAALPWVEGAVSVARAIDNRPPTAPVALPAAAPRPRRALRPQPRATGEGAHVVVSRIPAGVWRQMRRVSWHPGCPVGRSGLRLVRVNYWDYSGYGRRGELVAAASAAGPMGAVFAEMWQRGLPVRAMWRVDRFGWGSRSRGGNDYASMAAGNTSAFNCRDVTGRPGVTSPHSYGRALDLNTWENPYRSARGLVPNTWWQAHTHPRVAWRSRSHAVVRLLARHGFRWTYGLGDTQHFDYVGSRARALVAPERCRRYCD